MTKNIISAVGSDIIFQELTKREYQVKEDIPYQEGIIEVLRNELADILIVSDMIEGEYDNFLFIKKIRESDKNIKIILISDNEDNNYRNYLFKNGIYEVLTDGKFSIHDVINAIDREQKNIEELSREVITLKKELDKKEQIITEVKLIPKIQRQEIITVSGTEGSGKSTFITQLSILLAKQSNAKILVMDLNTASAGLYQYLGVKNTPDSPEYILPKDKSSSLNYMIDSIDKRTFDSQVFERYIIKSKKFQNLDILTGNSSLYICKNVLDREYYIRILEKAKQLYDFILIDTSSNIFLDSTQFAVNVATKIFFITEANYISFTKTEKILKEIYKVWEVKNAKIRVIINKFDKGSLEREIMEELLKGYMIAGYIKYSSRYNECLNNFKIYILENEADEYSNLLKEFNFMPKSSMTNNLIAFLNNMVSTKKNA